MKKDDILEKNYHLKENPFIGDIGKEELLNTWVDRKKQLKDWLDILNLMDKGRKNTIVFVIGEYGLGKTLSLLKIVLEAKKNKGILPIYISFKAEQKTKDPGLDFIFRLLKSLHINNLVSMGSKNKLNKTIESLPENYSEVKNILKAIISDDDQKKKLALYTLSGEVKPTKSDLKLLNILRKIDNVDIAKEYLACILYVYKNLGINSVLFALDEFEYLFSLVPKSQRTIYLALLRGLYDFPIGMSDISENDIAKIGLFIAISQDGWRKLNEMEEQEEGQGGPIQPLFRRIDKNSVLTPFNEEETKELIELRLKYNRTSRKYEDKPLIPYTKDFVNFVFKLTNGELWHIIKICAHVLDGGIEKGAKILDRKFAEYILKERGEI